MGVYDHKSCGSLIFKEYQKLWGTTVSRNALLTTTKESPDFSHGECQLISNYAPEFSGKNISDFNFTWQEEKEMVVVESKDGKIRHNLHLSKIGNKYYFMGF